MDQNLRESFSTKRPRFFGSNKINTIVYIFFQSIPVIFSSVSGMVFLIISTYFAGHLEDVTYLASLGLSSVWLNFVGFGPLLSFNLGFFALASQVNGTGNQKNLKILFQRCIIFDLILFIISTILLLFSPHILTLTGADEKVVEKGVSFIYMNIPVLFLEIFLDIFKNLLNAQKLFFVYPTIAFINIVFHFILCSIFMNLNFGLLGLAISKLIINIITLIMLLIYIKWKHFNIFLFESFEWEATQNLIAYSKIVIPSGLITYMEWMAFEILTIMASNFDEYILSSHTLFFYIIAFIFNMAIGIGVTYSSFLGNFIGNKDQENSEEILSLLNPIIIIMAILYEIFSLLLFEKSVELMTNNKIIYDILMNMFPVLCFLTYFDFFQGFNANVLRVLGKQDYATFLYFKTYYLIGLPLAFYFGVICKFTLVGWFSSLHFAQLLFCIFSYRKIKRTKLKEIFNDVNFTLQGQFAH